MMKSSSLTRGTRAFGSLPPSHRACPPAASDMLFLDLLGRYRSHGGLASSTRVEALMSERGPGRGEVLSSWIRNGEVLWLAWHDEAWLPMFQLRAAVGGSLMPRADVQSVATELRCVCDELDLCGWFVKPNGWLDGRPPAAVLGQNQEIVRAAARADRFVLGG
jgi:hypothetical protein